MNEMVQAYEKAYERRNEVDRDKLREFAGQYAVDVVAEKFMAPAVDTLLERVKRLEGEVAPAEFAV